MSVYARGCAESQSSSLVLMFPVCRWMCVCAHSCVCVYLCLMGRLMEETRGSELCPIGYRNQLTQALPRLMPRSLLSSPLSPSVFFFSLPASLSIHLSHLRLHLAFLLLVIDLLVILSPSSLGYFRFPFALSLPSYLSIFTRHPPLLFSLPLPPCLWLSSSDRLLMQAVYESISPSAVVELAPLLSRQDLFISLPTSA